MPTQREYEPTLVGATAGWPPPRPLLSGGLGVDGRLCTPVRTSVPFSTRGLAGGVARRFGQESTCYAPRAVLVRIRASFREATALTSVGKTGFLSASGRIEKARIMVRTPDGKPLAYGEVADSGTARLFAARSCF